MSLQMLLGTFSEQLNHNTERYYSICNHNNIL